MMNRNVLNQLILDSKNDPDLLEAVQDALLSFEEYHQAIYSMEIKKNLLINTIDPQQYREEVSAMDRNRTARHNAVLANVDMLNRIAAQAGLSPMYDGIVSQEQPYRRQVADDILAFVNDIILKRP